MAAEDRQPMTPTEFDAACREFIKHVPQASQTSGYRTVARNLEMGGHPESKHLIGMAGDFVIPYKDIGPSAAVAVCLGFWIDRSPWRCSPQGLPVGPLPDWWVAKFGGLPNE